MAKGIQEKNQEYSSASPAPPIWLPLGNSHARCHHATTRASDMTNTTSSSHPVAVSLWGLCSRTRWPAAAGPTGCPVPLRAAVRLGDPMGGAGARRPVRTVAAEAAVPSGPGPVGLPQRGRKSAD